MNYKVLFLQERSAGDDENGALAFAEQEIDIPFDIKRLYHIYNVRSGVSRGFHAHKRNSQFLFCPYGSITIILDDGCTREEVVLDHPAKGLLLGPGLWREMVWNLDDSVLCVAASEHYDEDDYIRDYDQFLQYVWEHKA